MQGLMVIKIAKNMIQNEMWMNDGNLVKLMKLECKGLCENQDCFSATSAQSCRHSYILSEYKEC